MERFNQNDGWEIDLGKICDSKRVWEFIDYRRGSSNVYPDPLWHGIYHANRDIFNVCLISDVTPISNLRY